jgi:hypothetical protein
VSEEIVYSKILEDGRVRCGHCGNEHGLLPPDKVEVLNSLWCDTCGKASLLRPDEQLAYYRGRGMEPAPVAETPSLVWNGTSYTTAVAPAVQPTPASSWAPPATGGSASSSEPKA